jgi:SAM-dependent methyltransferase
MSVTDKTIPAGTTIPTDTAIAIDEVAQQPATEDGGAPPIVDALFAAALGTGELAVIHLGRELGIYAAMRDAGFATPSEIAGRAGIDDRYTREWLEHQAVAGIVEVDDPSRGPDDRRYALPEVHAAALLDEEDPTYVGAMADIVPIVARTLGLVTDAFRAGGGVPFAAYGLHDMQAGFTRPMFAHSLVDEWLPALGTVHDRLAAGEALRVADFGCGEGWAAIYLAEAFPAVHVDGFDLDDASIAAARRNAAARGVDNRVRFEVRDVTGPDMESGYDLVWACEVVHDLSDPVSALRAMRRATGDRGTVLIIDERADETLQPNGDPLQRLLYVFSILHCLPVGRSGEHSAGTGTVMRPATLRRYATDAGFTDVEVLDIDHPMFRFYRLGDAR